MPRRNGTTEAKSRQKKTTPETASEDVRMEPKMQQQEFRSSSEKQPGQQSSGGIGQILSENPLPLAMVWLGASWLAMKAMSGGKASTPPPTDMMREKVDTATTAAGETVGQVVTSTTDVVSKVVGGAQGALVTLAQGAPRKAGQVTTAIGTQATRAQTSAGKLFEESPLLLSAAAVAGGVALGLVAPTTKAESEALAGPTTKIVERAETFASQAVDSMEQSANGG
jgi:hypothetical protein